MPNRLPSEIDALPASALDHASEFVAIVIERTPSVYAGLLNLPEMQRRLEHERTFNHGKLLAWAEYLVFRTEFMARFPEASQPACINAFSRLFLKNDISITNLAAVMEPDPDEEMAMLSGPHGGHDGN